MRKAFKIIEQKFWVVFLLGVFLGLFFPHYGNLMQSWIKPILVLMLYLVFLKIDIKDVLTHIQKPKLMTYLMVAYLLVIPALTYVLVSPFNSSLAVGLLLLSATPPAMAAPALTSIVKGNAALSLAIVIVGSLLAPLTLPLIFALHPSADVSIDAFAMFQTLLVLVVVPLLLSQVTRKFFNDRIEEIKYSFSSLTIVLVALVLFIVLAGQQEVLLENPIDALWLLFYVYLFLIINHIISYNLCFWLKKEDKIAISVSKTYMNNALSIVIAYSFFSPEIVLITVLSEIPFATMLGPFSAIVKRIGPKKG